MGLALGIMAAALAAQTQEDSFDVYTEHPRLLLRPQRLRLLRREKERSSIRWQQFQTLVAGKAPMPEKGFAYALYYVVSGEKEFGREAVAWASTSADLRQVALVLDWCNDLLSDAQSKTLTAKLRAAIERPARDKSVAAVRSRAFAAIAVGEGKELERIVRGWWQGGIVPALKTGKDLIARDDLYALYELFHAVRDNVNIDLRDAFPGYFKDVPVEHLLSYYPATYPAPEGEFRIPVAKETTEPDTRRAALSRAVELSMVAYDVNDPGSQVLQGWLMHDHFLMRGTFGIPYEFLWANPYQPGLSYYHVPLVFHNPRYGRLWVRSSWDESAIWLGYFDGRLQTFQNGGITVMNPQLSTGPLDLAEAIVLFNSTKFRISAKDDQEVFVIGLKPSTAYDVEVDGEEIREEATDPGGILELKLPPKIEIGVRMKPAPISPRSKSVSKSAPPE